MNGADIYSDDFQAKFKKSVYAGLLYSVFDDEGPTPKFVYPESLDFAWQLQIAMKTISLMMGERTYQDGDSVENVRYYGILPFPDFGLNALTFFFLIEDEAARGQAKAATITLLIPERYRNFFFENIKYLRLLLDTTASKIDNSVTGEKLDALMTGFIQDIVEYSMESARTPAAERQLKVLFTGLDNSGKTSILLAVKKRYSELLGVKPTKGVQRTKIKILGTTIHEWDLAGQVKYRDAFIKQAETYLYDVDVVYYVADVQDGDRIQESVEFFKKVLDRLRSFDQHPPIVVCLHKVDPDLRQPGSSADKKQVNENIDLAMKLFKVSAKEFHVKFFETSVFNNWSLISAFSYGVSRLSPNREAFRLQLEWFARNVDARAVLLLNENALVLSDYSEDEVAERVFEMSAPHFQSLYRTFKEFKLMNKDHAVWKMEEGLIHYKRVTVDHMNLYLLFYTPETDEQTIEGVIPEFRERIGGLVDMYL